MQILEWIVTVFEIKMSLVSEPEDRMTLSPNRNMVKQKGGQ